MMELFDTNILVDNIKGDERARVALARHTPQAISRIVWMELLAGARPSDGVVLEHYLASFRVLDLDLEICTRTVQLRRSFTRMKLPDAMIYATALVHGLTLVTRNTRDFQEGMEGIRIPYRTVV